MFICQNPASFDENKKRVK